VFVHSAGEICAHGVTVPVQAATDVQPGVLHEGPWSAQVALPLQTNVVKS
jgi:hypothetical protein